MESYILFICIVTFVIIGAVIEFKRYKNIFSPFNLFAIPYIFIIFIQFISVNYYHWTSVSMFFLAYVLIFILITFITSSLFYKVFHENIPKKFEGIEQVALSKKIWDIIFLTASIYLLISFFNQMNGVYTLGMIVQEEFQSIYGSGLNFYLRLLAMIGTVYYWGRISKENKHFFMLGLICFLPNALTFVKGIAFLMVIASFIANLLINNKKINLFKASLIPIIGTFIFYLVYMIEIGIWNPEKLKDAETYQFISGKLNYYLISGVQSFNVNISENTLLKFSVENPVFAPILNVLSKIGLGDRLDTIGTVWTNIGVLPSIGHIYVNTNTYIGTLVLYSGITVGLLIHLLLSIFMYILFLNVLNKKRIIWVLLYTLLISGFVLSWFDYFYMQTFWAYLIFILILISLFEKINFGFPRLIIKEKKESKGHYI